MLGTCFYQQASHPFALPYLERPPTPPPPATAPGPPSTLPPISSFACLIFFALCCRSKLTRLQGAGGRNPARRRPAPDAHTEACTLEILLHRVRGGGRHDKDDSLCGGTLSAAATRNLFRKKDFLHNGGGCEKRGHILKEEPSCVHGS